MPNLAKINKDKRKNALTILAATIILIFGVLIRFTRLSVQPLTSEEADLAWQAFQVSNANLAESPGFVAQVSLASLTFFLTQANAFTARIGSVLIGCGLILLPWLWKKELGRSACLIISLALAIDPLLSASTRVLGSPMFAMATFLLALGFIKHKQFILAGIALAMAFLGGPSFWLGLTSLGLALLIKYLVERSASLTEDRGSLPSYLPIFEKPGLWSLLGGFLATLVIIGSFFLRYPAGLGSISAALLAFLQVFSNPSGVSFWQILLALLVYSIVPVAIGGVGIVNGIIKKDLTTIFLASWLAVALLLILLMPGRQVFDLIWVILPLYVLSGRVLSEVLDFTKEGVWTRVVIMAFCLVICTFLTMTIRSFALNVYSSDQVLTFALSILVGVILLVLGFLLIGTGWGYKQSWQGLLYALLILAIILSTSGSLSWVGERSGNKAEIWQTSSTLDAMHTLENVISEQSKYAYGKPTAASILVIANDSPAIRWALRKFEYVEFQSRYSGEVQADVILTDQTMNASINSDYRGTNITISNHPQWTLSSGKALFQWTQSRKINQVADQYYLWVKTDILPFGKN